MFLRLPPRFVIQKAFAAADGADGVFKQKVVNGVKKQPGAAGKKRQQQQNKVVYFFLGFNHAVAVVAVFHGFSPRC